MVILVIGGAGFIGSHVAEYYAKEKDEEVIVVDNLSRADLLGYKTPNAMYNWNYLKRYDNIKLIKADIRDAERIREIAKDTNFIIHAAAQTAVTTSIRNPRTDFEINAFGTFNVLEAARLSKNNPCVIFCSTNKIYGNNVNKIPLKGNEKRYVFADSNFKNGIKEDFPVDLCEHTPYGCSKFTGDIYAQDYAHIYGLKIGIFRMSCIYGSRQFGVEDQGWVAWFAIAMLTDHPITIYGDGKQVRDVLYVTDLIRAYDAFWRSNLKSEVFNIGGGVKNSLSLRELLELLERLENKKPSVIFNDWRPSDQKVYLSDISKMKVKLDWEPKVDVNVGIRKLTEWGKEVVNRESFVHKL